MSNAAATQPGSTSHWHAALEAACRIVAPAWPLDRQIAVSPYWGLRNQPFAAAAATLRTLAGASLTLSRTDYRNAWRSGEIAPFAVGTALASSPPHGSVLAALPHTALTSDDGGTALLGPRVKDAGSG